jgi:hypothetical protein
MPTYNYWTKSSGDILRNSFQGKYPWNLKDYKKTCDFMHRCAKDKKTKNRFDSVGYLFFFMKDKFGLDVFLKQQQRCFEITRFIRNNSKQLSKDKMTRKSKKYPGAIIVKEAMLEALCVLPFSKKSG